MVVAVGERARMGQTNGSCPSTRKKLWKMVAQTDLQRYVVKYGSMRTVYVNGRNVLDRRTYYSFSVADVVMTYTH